MSDSNRTPAKHRGNYITLKELYNYWADNKIDDLIQSLGNGEFPQVFEFYQICLQSIERLEVDPETGAEFRISQNVVTSLHPNAEVRRQEFTPVRYEDFREYEIFTRSLIEFEHLRRAFMERVVLHYEFLAKYAEAEDLKLPDYWQPSCLKKDPHEEMETLLEEYVSTGGELPPLEQLRVLLRTSFSVNFSEHRMEKVMDRVMLSHPNKSKRRPKVGRPNVGRTQKRLSQLSTFLESKRPGPENVIVKCPLRM